MNIDNHVNEYIFEEQAKHTWEYAPQAFNKGFG